MDYCYIALNGKGKLAIADSPQLNCDFKNLLKETHLHSIQDLYREIGFPIEIFDLRPYCWGDRLSSNPIQLKGDPLGYTDVNLDDKSEFAGMN